MELREILSMLQGVHGPSGAGEYQARCPAHDDRHASLSIREGDKGIVMHCKAGCNTADICSRLGIKMRDLFTSHDNARQRPQRAKAGKTQEANAPYKQDKAAGNVDSPRVFSSVADAFGYLGIVEKVYDYTDANGSLLFMVVRIRQAAGKTFRQCRPADPDRREPVVMSVADMHKHVLYRLPEVCKAIASSRPIIVVEGEKDADALADLGYTATTCSMGAGKWCDECSAQLKDGIVYVMGDNDEPGRKHVSEVAESLLDVAAQVYTIDVLSESPDLPPKGDISDALELVAATQRSTLVNALLAGAQPAKLSSAGRLRRVERLYRECLTGYGAKNGCIVQYTSDTPEGKQLTTFVAVPTKVIERDDGVNIEKVFEVEGWTRGGQPLKPVQVSAADFGSMQWATKLWDFAANIAPGSTNRDKVRYILTEVGARVAKRQTVYTHTGWRQIDGHWAYLYQGGAIGASDVSVDLGSGLGSYSLDFEDDGKSDSEAIIAQFFMRTAIPEHIYVPLIGTMYLAPLREFLVRAGCPPAYALFLLGGTGTRKSTVAALALCFFGKFTAKSLPASFNDTANYIKKRRFCSRICP